MLARRHRGKGTLGWLVSASLVLTTSCILIVDPPDSGDRCLFQGRESDCGRCIAARCQKEVDACCGSDSCGGLIGAVEGCAGAGDERCAEVHAAASGVESARTTLASCVTALCRGVCERSEPTSSTRCGETRFSAATACACLPSTDDLPANRYQCNSQLFPNSRCCAPPGWPSAGNQCACLVVSCSPLGDGCTCSLVDTFDSNATTRCAGDFCCQDDRTCHCGSAACRPSETRVSACNIETVSCGGTAVEVESCSLP